MKLQLKPTIIPYQTHEQVVLQVNGSYAKVPDPDGAIWTLIKGMDGTRTVNGLIDHVLSAFPQTNLETLKNTIDDCIKYRMVELPEQEVQTTLDEKSRIRFSRNIDFFGSMAAFGESKYTYQEKLRDRKICVLGCGGLGTHILFDLAAVGAQNLTLLDFDKIELSNLNRQILYKESDIGSEKVETAKRRLLEFNSELNITTHSKRLTCTQDVANVVRGHDLVICVADKPVNYIGDWLNEACVQHKVPFITGGLDIRRSIFFSVTPGVSGCESCWLKSARGKSRLVNDISVMVKGQDITYDRPAPAFVTLVAVTAGMMVSEAVNYLTGCHEPQLNNKLKEFCFDDLSVGVAETWTRDSSCPVCGHL